MKSNKLDLKYKEQKGNLVRIVVRKMVLIIFLFLNWSFLRSLNAPDGGWWLIVYDVLAIMTFCLGIYSIIEIIQDLGLLYKLKKDFLEKQKPKIEKEILHIEGPTIEG